MHRHDQHHRVIITEICNVRMAETLRRRPLHWSRGEPCRQLPRDAGWLTRITWIDPVNVPTLLELEMQPERERMPRCDPLTLGDEFQRAVLDGCARRPRAYRTQQQGHPNSQSGGKSRT